MAKSIDFFNLANYLMMLSWSFQKPAFLLTSCLILSGSTLAQTNFRCLSEYSEIRNSKILIEHNESDSLVRLINCLLTSYNELEELKIVIKRRNIGTLAAARPRSNFLFQKKVNRSYLIILNKRVASNADSLYYYMPCKAFVGLLAHEFGHLVEYNEMSSLRLLAFGISYYFNKKKIERRIDKICISRGFGQELLVFNQYIRTSPFSTEKYLKNKNRHYLSVGEITDSLDTM